MSKAKSKAKTESVPEGAAAKTTDEKIDQQDVQKKEEAKSQGILRFFQVFPPQNKKENPGASAGGGVADSGKRSTGMLRGRVPATMTDAFRWTSSPNELQTKKNAAPRACERGRSPTLAKGKRITRRVIAPQISDTNGARGSGVGGVEDNETMLVGSSQSESGQIISPDSRGGRSQWEG